MSPEIGDSLPYFQILDIVSAMNVPLLLTNTDLDFLPKYVVPACTVGALLYVMGILLYDHFAIKRDKAWKHPKFFMGPSYEKTRIMIDPEAVLVIKIIDLPRLTKDERWFVLWFRYQRWKRITFLSTPVSIPLSHRSQIEISAPHAQIEICGYMRNVLSSEHAWYFRLVLKCVA